MITNPEGLFPIKNKAAALIILAVCATIALTVARIYQFQDLEPRMDQAFMIDWVQSIYDADRFFPRQTDGQSWLAALEADERSLLHAAIKPVYVANTTLFVIGSVVWFSIGSLLTGVSTNAQIALSVISHSLMLLCLAALPVYGAGPNAARQCERWTIAGLTLAIAGTSSFLHGFSPLGAHNVAILALIAVVMTTSRYLTTLRNQESSFRGLLAVALVQALACYTSYTNVFLLPVATVSVLLLQRPALSRRRLLEAWRFSILILIGFLPAIALITLSAIRPHTTNQAERFGDVALWVFASGDQAFPSVIATNFISWFELQSEIFSSVGLALGIVGLVLIWIRYRQPLPLAIAVAHLVIWALMAGFGAKAGQYTRTSAYLTPFLALGLATAIVWGAQWALRIYKTSPLRACGLFAATLASLAGHLMTDSPRLANLSQTPGWGGYYSDQNVWRPILRYIEAEATTSTIVFPWDQSTAYMLRTLRRRHAGMIRVYQPFKRLSEESRRGTLNSYIQRRDLNIPATAAIYLLLPARLAQREAASMTTDILCRDKLRTWRRTRLSVLENWPGPGALVQLYGGGLVLYRVEVE